MWWKAQCAFRGQSTKGKMVELQDTLRGHEEDAMIKELRELEVRSKGEYRVKNKEAKEEHRIQAAKALDEKWLSGKMSSD